MSEDKKGKWLSLFEWRVSAADVARQLAEYDTLAYRLSYRKQAAFLLVLVVALSWGLFVLTVEGWLLQGAVVTIVYGLLAGFVYRSSRWSCVAAIIVFWWVFMQSFAKSYHVESARAKARRLAAIPRDPLGDS